MSGSLARLAVGALAVCAIGIAGCGDGSPTPLDPSAASTTGAPSLGPTDAAHRVSVTLSEFSVAGSPTALPAGTYRFEIMNSGQAPHELLVFRTNLAPSALPMEDGDVNEEGPGVNKMSDGDNIAAGGHQTRGVDLSVPGSYLLVCNLPGHFRAGMVRAITVS